MGIEDKLSETSGEDGAGRVQAPYESDASTAKAMHDPAPPAEFVEAAKLAPDHWLYLIDPAWSDEGPPPEWAVVGQWRSDARGEIVEWQDNEDYKPSPAAMGWPEPADELDAAIQLATTGYGPGDSVTQALARVEVAVLVTAGGGLVRAAAPDGTPVVLVYSSPKYLHNVGRLSFETMRIVDFRDRIPEGHSLCINSSGPVSMVMSTEGLDDVLAAVAGAPGDATVNVGTLDADVGVSEEVLRSLTMSQAPLAHASDVVGGIGETVTRNLRRMS
ncbi:type VII secretion system-associated protein [Streptomyces sp. NPDC088788]|uniref:type VII secretion system-associated protein n=1 Tax=Streptomyces sp. NPDC088788 TaxID=3365898 RepID=UPI0038134A91